MENKISEIVESTSLKHIAIIMDGNRRYAKLKNLPSASGHKFGVDALKRVVKAAHKFNVKYLTVYAFSTENWNRSKEEVNFLMNLLASTIKNELSELSSNNVRLRFIGGIEALSGNLQKILNEAEIKTAQNTGVNLQIAVNYGARAEIINAVNKILTAGAKSVSEADFEKFLYTADIPDPDLLIRTGGEFRVSNYLLWQIAYSEIYITEKFWPEFDESALADSILEFAKRIRRYGK